MFPAKISGLDPAVSAPHGAGPLRFLHVLRSSQKSVVVGSSCRYSGRMSSFLLNVTFDCADPRAQAEFWSGVTGYSVSDRSQPGNPFWLVGSPPGEAGPRLVFVPVREPKLVKNRVHVDIVPADRSQSAELDRLLALGASVVDDRRQVEGGGWVVLADPEGNEFCLESD